MLNHFFYLDATPRTTREGPLKGCRIAVQSNISVRDWPVPAGSLALENYTALEDATVIERARLQGGVIVGSTHMSELGFGLRGDAGAAVMQVAEADALIATDFLGEARITAADAGVFGFKPTYGLVSRFGLVGLIPSMESYGLISPSLRTIATLLSGVAGPDGRDFSMPDRQTPDLASAPFTAERVIRAGVPVEVMDMLTETERQWMHEGMRQLAACGVDVTEVSLPEFRLFSTVHGVMGSVEASSSAGKYDGVRYGHRAQGAKNWNDMYLKTRGESFGTLVKSYLFQGAYFQFEQYEIFEKAGRIRSRLIRSLGDLLGTVDVLVMPTKRALCSAREAQTVSDVYQAFALTLCANVAGLPALQVPGFVTGGTEDLGMQLIGPAYGDADLFSLANHVSERKGAN